MQVLDKQGIIYQPNLGVYANNLSIMQVYLWYKDQNGETYFSQLLNENKNFCTLRDPKAVLNQQYNLASILYYQTSDGIAFSDPIKENRTSQKITSNRVYTQYKVVDYFGYRKTKRLRLNQVINLYKANLYKRAFGSFLFVMNRKQREQRPY